MEVECAKCHHKNSRVLDSRPIEEGKSIRRRRECESCSYRFTTFERREEEPLIIVKKDGTRQVFEKDKLKRGLLRACEKRPVTIEEIEEIALDVERRLRESDSAEINSHDIGEIVLDRLLEIDEVAYVRFASVYRQYQNVNVFLQELQELLTKQGAK